jgi:hypothetical protein
LEDLVKETNEF